MKLFQSLMLLLAIIVGTTAVAGAASLASLVSENGNIIRALEPRDDVGSSCIWMSMRLTYLH
jgi:hypothetical protein